MIEIRVNRSYATRAGPQLRNPSPGLTTKSKLLERVNKAPKLSYPKNLLALLIFLRLKAFSIRRLHFPLR
jgi:hypothetical protein